MNENVSLAFSFFFPPRRLAVFSRRISPPAFTPRRRQSAVRKFAVTTLPLPRLRRTPGERVPYVGPPAGARFRAGLDFFFYPRVTGL